MKIGVSQLVLGDSTLEHILEICRVASYDAVELVFKYDADLDVDMSSSGLLEVRERCTSAGVTITSVIALTRNRGSLLSPSAGDRQRYCASVVRALEIAEVLEAGAVLLHPGQLVSSGTYDAAWHNMRECLTELAGEAEKRKTAIGLENVWNKILLTPREAREFVDEVDSSWVGVYLDTANMMEYGYPEHWIRALGTRIKRVHLKDYSRSKRSFANLLEGDTDWPTVMTELRNIQYDAGLIHEIAGNTEAMIEIGHRMRKIASL
jgi:hexulose-6-phosphate isomerase